MKWVFVAFLSCSAVFSAVKTVELVSNFKVNVDDYTSLFTQRGYDIQVVPSDFSHYERGLKKNRSRLAKILRKCSLDFPRSIPIPHHVEKILFFNITNHDRKLELHKLDRDKMVLFMWEPRNVLPRMYEPETTDLFGRIYTWDDDLVDDVKYFKFYYPVLQPMIQDPIPFQDKKLCTFVGSNLKGKSPQSLYRERRAAIEFFEAHNEEGFEFYGKRWEGLNYKSYRGTTPDKIATIKHYRFSICYENCHGVKGYVTEKIFDCFAAANVPIYWGASNITDYIPKECFIDRRSFDSMETLYHYLKTMTEETYNSYLDHIREFLASDRAQLFSKEHFESLLVNAIHTK